MSGHGGNGAAGVNPSMPRLRRFANCQTTIKGAILGSLCRGFDGHMVAGDQPGANDIIGKAPPLFSHGGAGVRG